MSRLANRLDVVGLLILAALGGSVVVAHGLITVLDGLSSADDPYIALVARMVADGAGYVVPRESDVVVPFDFGISTGPTMIVPLALAIDVFGVSDRLPGAVALAMFGAIGVVAAAIVRSRASGNAALAFAAAFLLLLAAGTREMRLVGVFLGESVTFGLVMLALLLLADTRGRASAFLGGLAAGLAVLAKLIAFFPVAGLALAYVALELRRHGPTRKAVERPALGALGVGLFMVPFELARVMALGVGGYFRNWADTFGYSGMLGARPASPLDLPRILLDTIQVQYISLGVLAVAVVAVVGAVLWRRSTTSTGARDRPDEVVNDFVPRALTLAIAALAAQWTYLLLRGSVYDRYIYVGVGLIFVVIALALLLAPRRHRLLPVAAIGMAAVLLDPAALAIPTSWDHAARLHAERAAVVAAIDAHPGLPYAAAHWPAMYQVAAVRLGPGVWSYGRDAGRFAGQRILVVDDAVLSSPDDPFVVHSRATCVPLTPDAVRLRLYDCGAEFWRAHLDPRAFSEAPPPGLDAAKARAGGQCNVEHFGRETPRNVHLVAGRSAAVPIFGWAVDPGRRLAPERVVLELADTTRESRWFVETQPEPRPDLGNTLGAPGATGFGFKAAASFAAVPAGVYRLSALILVAGEALECDSRLVVTVT